jgi:hypothetical protein
LQTDSADQIFARTSRPHKHTPVSAAHTPRSQRPRMPSTSGYMAAAGVTAGALFFVLWWMLHSGGDESPWVPAGLAASVVMVVAAAAREVVMRRAWTRYILDQGREHPLKNGATHSPGSRSSSSRSGSSRRSAKLEIYATALRAIQKQSVEADAPGAMPDAHLEAYHLCKEYLTMTDEALRNGNISGESRVALRSGQERVRALQKHHLLSWASASSRTLTHEAQKRVLVSDKIETAMRALDVIDAALKVYPEEAELHQSAAAVRDYMTSVRVARWVEMAERAAFKGHYRRAIDRYRDALFYLSRGEMKEESRVEAAERIGREIELLRARLKTGRAASKKGEQAMGERED